MTVKRDAAVWTALRIHANDNVAMALRDLHAGERPSLHGGSVPRLLHDIPQGHKFALAPIEAGGMVIKYGHPVGIAVVAIVAGDHVHLHNIEGLAGRNERGTS